MGNVYTSRLMKVPSLKGSNNRSLNGKKRQHTIHRIPGESQNQTPDVETVGLPFNVYKNIFVRLSMRDLATCMLVCKEWRSLIDTCTFWREYLAHHYDFGLREPASSSPLYDWKYHAGCLKLSKEFMLEYANDPPINKIYVFKPFPDVWISGIVVPNTLNPPDGNLEIYHNFISAIDWLQTLRDRIQQRNLSNKLQVCLFQWIRERMPKSKEVLDIFNAHWTIVKSVNEAKDLSKSEFKHYLSYLNSQNNQQQFDIEFFNWFVETAGHRTIIFDCSTSVVKPAPCFILTQISCDWVGGLLYGR